MVICMAGFCPIYSFSLFLPTIIKNMGYTANQAQLMSVPPYVVACFFTIVASYLADKFRTRGIFMLGFQLVAITGFAMLAGSAKSHIQYGGTVLAAIGTCSVTPSVSSLPQSNVPAGIYPQIPLGLAWNGNNIGGSMKRGTGIAMQVMGGNCGGIIASYVYLTRDSPRYVAFHPCLPAWFFASIILISRPDSSKATRSSSASSVWPSFSPFS